MLHRSRFVALALVALATITVVGCSGDASKIVGKWKLVSATKDGKEEKLDLMGITPIIEFAGDGSMNVGIDPSSLPAALKDKIGTKANETKKVGKYKVTGDTIEFLETEKSGDSPFGKSNKGKLKFEGDTLTITGDDGSLKLSRAK